jgi:hypothetical protein
MIMKILLDGAPKELDEVRLAVVFGAEYHQIKFFLWAEFQAR